MFSFCRVDCDSLKKGIGSDPSFHERSVSLAVLNSGPFWLFSSSSITSVLMQGGGMI